ATLLRRIAVRDDFRCVGFKELATVADRWWHGPRELAADPIYVLHTVGATTSVTGSRTYIADALAAPPPRPPGPDDTDDVIRTAPVDFDGASVLLIGGHDGAADALREAGAAVERTAGLTVPDGAAPDVFVFADLHRGDPARIWTALCAAREHATDET